MKKLLSIVLAALMAASLFTACAAKAESAAPAESQTTASETTSTETAAPASSEASSDATSYTIGICNYVDDASLNQIVENIQTRLAAIGEEKGVTFNVEYDNCNADSNLMSQIISNFQAGHRRDRHARRLRRCFRPRFRRTCGLARSPGQQPYRHVRLPRHRSRHEPPVCPEPRAPEGRPSV